MSKRDYIQEIIAKQSRLHRRGTRMDLFTRRVHPLVEGFRSIKSMDKSVSFRNEWLKYGAIGYIACVEGYFRILIADLINYGDPFLSRVPELKEIKFNAEAVVAIHKRKVSIGEFVAHLLPINGVSDVNSHLSALAGDDFLRMYLTQPCSGQNTKSVGEVFPREIGMVEKLFKLRHLYAHELATKEKVPVKEIDSLVGSAAMFVWYTEKVAINNWLTPNNSFKPKPLRGSA
ncbi:hypothetical protein [Pseudoxanthomonas sp. SE1]|uniref:hypothetical protein n=1 Tax=Pseudoxanthomonas sp. SE1 TaxID=1664560 RepID=UPI00240D2D6E|nr:hypothetical protein [Pseudoxanthomonas sp. SE1]WFC41830.1 hypothetical protein OY559_19030 [Pseudoxanthomonas sp. SE1]